jgi:ATP-dependent DNA helicase RecG
MQSGIALDLHIANLATDGQIIQLARDAADDVLNLDPELSSPTNYILKQQLEVLYNKTIDWSRIS